MCFFSSPICEAQREFRNSRADETQQNSLKQSNILHNFSRYDYISVYNRRFVAFTPTFGHYMSDGRVLFFFLNKDAPNFYV